MILSLSDDQFLHAVTLLIIFFSFKKCLFYLLGTYLESTLKVNRNGQFFIRGTNSRIIETNDDFPVLFMTETESQEPNGKFPIAVAQHYKKTHFLSSLPS